ncbi:MAG: adenylate/guanylate cyclase domain-containing protein [Candidatus Tectimicrobiota bacterium]
MQRTALRIYWYASCLAVAEAFLLFSLGLDLRLEQVRTLVLCGFPAPILMYMCDRWLILRHVQPIVAFQEGCEHGRVATPQEARAVYIHALNLPILTLLRVLAVHAPAVLLPATGCALLANDTLGLGLAWWQFLVIWSFWPITAVPHAMVEYFLIQRLVQRTLIALEPLVGEAIMEPIPAASARTIVRLLLGQPPGSPRLIRISTGMQLGWLALFVGVTPMCVLGASVYLKVSALDFSATPQALRLLGGWIVCLLLISAGVNVAIVSLLSRQMQQTIAALLRHMRNILEGDLSGHWSPRTTDEFFDLGVGLNAMLLGLRERESIKDTFGRFVSREVAEAVLAGRVPLQGELREITVLFQDIRGFTSLSEQTAPEALLHMLNAFFTEMVAAVETHGGVVKQFTGDGVMALFGAPGLHTEHPTLAVRSALDMLRRLEMFNQQRLAHGAVPLRIGIGIHTGTVVAGCVGPDTRLEYSVVGDAVNVASRVQELTKELAVSILATGETAARLPPHFVLGTQAIVPIRGKTQPVSVVEIVSAQPG